MGGKYFSAPFLPLHVRQLASNVTAFTVLNAEHWLVQENTQPVVEDLLSLLTE